MLAQKKLKTLKTRLFHTENDLKRAYTLAKEYEEARINRIAKNFGVPSYLSAADEIAIEQERKVYMDIRRLNAIIGRTKHHIRVIQNRPTIINLFTL